MPAPSSPLPPVLAPVHLYRHLLREASYLPPAFRATIAAIIQDRFHRNQDHDPRAKAHLGRARSALRTLRAANCGDKKAMEGLIFKGFARAGSRRRELMAQFVKPQGPSDSQALESLLDGAAAAAQPGSPTSESSPPPQIKKNAFYLKWDQPKLLDMLRSQRTQQEITKGTSSWPAADVKVIDQDQFVPQLNVWGRRPADNVVRAKRARWWRLAADKMMPPLSKGEWELLGRLSEGVQDAGEWAVPQRRPSARPVGSPEEDTACGFDWEAYAMKPAAVVEKPKSLGNQQRSGQKDTGLYALRQRNPNISPRWFRRAYNRTWQLTATMSQDPNTLKNSFRWGKALSRVPPPTQAQLEIFEDVDSKGHKVGQGSAS